MLFTHKLFYRPVFSLRNPTVFLLIFCICYLSSALGLLIVFNRIADPGINFFPYRNQLSIFDSRMNLEDAAKEYSVHVVAVVTNQTDIAWKDVQLDVRFFNKAGTLIDARTFMNSPTIFPHGDSAFRINVDPIHPLADYDSYKIYIRSARDTRSRF
jgi:hypothetical protein